VKRSKGDSIPPRVGKGEGGEREKKKRIINLPNSERGEKAIGFLIVVREKGPRKKKRQNEPKTSKWGMGGKEEREGGKPHCFKAEAQRRNTFLFTFDTIIK